MLIISHDHYDHLDYKTIAALKDKVGTVICGLGVGAHFEHWGYAAGIILERDWNEEIPLGEGFQLYTLTARHKSGRSFKQDNTLWLSYMLIAPTLKIFIGGDSGYGPHFKDIGKKFGPIDLAILENGQYNLAWHYIHTLPAETLQAGRDLQAKRIFPVHAGKFRLGNHPWDEPYKEIIRINEDFNIPVLTPMIGEAVDLKDETQKFAQWWLEVK